MTRVQTYLEDAVLCAAERLERGSLDRRRVLQLGALLGLAGVGGAGSAQAAAKEIVFAMWGGDAENAYRKAWCEPYTKKSGIPVVLDGSGPSPGRARAMVQSKNVTWDILDGGVGTQASLGKLGVLEEIDYSIFDRAKTLPGLDYKWGASVFLYGSVLAYDTKALGGKQPESWADFFDVKKFPGKRVMYKYMAGALEAALLADGVPLDKLYPLDVDRGLEKIKSIKEHLVLWDTGASSQQVFRDGEVVMGQIWHTRANLLEQETKGRVKYTFNGGLLHPGVMSVMKDNPAGKKRAMEFLASMQDPAGQIELLKLLGNGPANPAAEGQYDPALAARNPSHPDNRKLMVVQNGDWYAENIIPVSKRFLDTVAS